MINTMIEEIAGCVEDAGFEVYRQFDERSLDNNRGAMCAVVGVVSQKDVAECLIGEALAKELETVVSVRLFGTVCQGRDAYELEEKVSDVFESLARSGELLSRVTRLGKMKQNGSLARLETDVELTLRTLEIEEEEQ